MDPVTEPCAPRYPFALVIPRHDDEPVPGEDLGRPGKPQTHKVQEGRLRSPCATAFGREKVRPAVGSSGNRESCGARGPEGRLRTISHLEGHAVSRSRAPGRQINSLNNSAPLIAYRGLRAA